MLKFWIFIGSFFLVNPKSFGQVSYSVPSDSWPESYGNHRAVLEVSKPAKVVGLELCWRRHDKHVEDHQFIIINEDSGDTIPNIFRFEVNNEQCRIAFGPVKETGTYLFYYLPYKPVYDNFFAGPYLRKENAPDIKWIKKSGIEKDSATWASFQKCEVLTIQARNEFHSFYPMEVIATKRELAQYLAKYNDPYLIFPEDRLRPIKMLNHLPNRWLQNEPFGKFRGVAKKNEYYAMQLGVYASNISLIDVQIVFSDLSNEHGEILPASVMTCFNTHGVDIEGNQFNIQVNVEKGKVQPLWIGMDISADINPGKYQGVVKVQALGQEEKYIDVDLTVENEILADRGDSETWRHSRLRWLNSTIGIDDEPVKPYTPIKVEDKTISFLGREVILNEFGFPSNVIAWENEVLAGPIKFTIESNNQIIQLYPENFSFTKKENGIIGWLAVSENDDIRLTCNGEIEFDGRMNYTCKVYAKKSIHLQDIRLEIPYKKEMATYMIGMGRMGGYTPEFHKSRWRREEDSFWLGNTKGGIHCELRGGSYHGPLLNLYQPNHPRSWYNSVNGGFRLDSEGDLVIATTYSGYRKMEPGSTVNYDFAFIITPIKKYNPNDQFDYKYEHSPYPKEMVINHGGNVMNVHHANEFNPFINYPFIANEKLKSLVDHWHKKNWKVKIYYTVRELSNYLTEIWALRSLGNEVLADGEGGGYQWLQEHLVDHYKYQWYTHIGDGIVDAAILNSGESRWYNYYLEGLAWLLKEIDIDGLYLDDFSYDRRILKRMRKIMESIKPEKCHIDVHSNNAFTRGPANQYLEIYPYIDRTWYGEGFNFDLMPADFWLSEVSGVPFGIVNELLLHRSVNKGRRGMVFAMVPRGDWEMWKFWDAFGIRDAKMIGYWEDTPAVTTDNKFVKATSYIKNGEGLIVLGSWLSEPTSIRLIVNWEEFGLNPDRVKIELPEIANYQESGVLDIDDSIPIDAKGVRFLLLKE